MKKSDRFQFFICFLFLLFDILHSFKEEPQTTTCVLIYSSGGMTFFFDANSENDVRGPNAPALDVAVGA
jgi:hypothetical protein